MQDAPAVDDKVIVVEKQRSGSIAETFDKVIKEYPLVDDPKTVNLYQAIDYGFRALEERLKTQEMYNCEVVHRRSGPGDVFLSFSFEAGPRLAEEVDRIYRAKMEGPEKAYQELVDLGARKVSAFAGRTAESYGYIIVSTENQKLGDEAAIETVRDTLVDIERISAFCGLLQE